MTSVVFFLPFPPSSNNLFPSSKSGKRFKSDDYKEWQRLAVSAISKQPRPTVPIGSCAVDYEYSKRDNRRRDVANFEKAVSDILVSQSILIDDCLIEDMRLRWVRGVPWDVRATIIAL